MVEKSQRDWQYTTCLRTIKQKIKTFCDGFACSIASVIFMAGDERVMNEASLLMIHNAWMYTAGNADQLRKDAADLDVITQASIAAYMSKVNITEKKLKELLDAETWLLPGDSLDMGFATSITASAQSQKAAASATKSLFKLLKNGMSQKPQEPTPEPTPEPEKPVNNKPMKFLSALMSRKEDQ